MALKTLQFPILSLPSNADDEQPQEIVTAKPQEAPTQIDLLPDLVLEEILSRVPAKTALCCKTVSKLWLSIIDDPVFAGSHFSRAPVCPLLVFPNERSSRKSTRIMHLVEGQTVADLDPRIGKSKLTSRIELPDGVNGRRATSSAGNFLPANSNATSCEGVLCWASRWDGCCIFLCNPLTAEYARLDLGYARQHENRYVFIGLGFYRATKMFQLLSMSRDKDSGWWPEVRTVGDTRWRRVGEGASQMDFSRKVLEVVYVNGAIYWRYDGDLSICSFHFDRALFQVVPLPQLNLLVLGTSNSTPKNISLGVLANSLCVSLVSPDDGHVELWVIMEMYHGMPHQFPWVKLYDVETKTTCLEHHGELWSRGHYRALTHLSNGEILMHDWKETFIVYDPKTGEERHFRALEHSFEDLKNCLYLQVVPHVPSLVKLKDALNMEGKGLKVLKGKSNFRKNGLLL